MRRKRRAPHASKATSPVPYMDLPTPRNTVNPKGITTQSPGLRGTSYPGESGKSNTTLKGLRHHAMRTTEMAATPLAFGVVDVWRQGTRQERGVYAASPCK